jgi:hypothetical protein
MYFLIHVFGPSGRQKWNNPVWYHKRAIQPLAREQVVLIVA